MTAIAIWAASGFAGWCIAWFLGKPILRFVELRHAIVRSRLRALYTPVPLPASWDGPVPRSFVDDLKKLEEVKQELRNAGLDMLAFGQSEPTARVLKWIGFDTGAMANAAAAYANFLDGPITTRVANDEALRKTLKIR